MSTKPPISLSSTWLVLAFLAFVAVSAQATDTFKLYINKSSNPDNVIILQDNAQTLITHTTEGIELEFPGVDIKFRCQSNVDGTADECTIAVKEGVTPVIDGGGGGGGGGNLAALIPRFGSSTSIEGGFTAQITNYDSNFSWTSSTTAGTDSISGSGLVTVSDLDANASATVTVRTSRSGYNSGSATVTGAAADDGGGGGGGGSGTGCTSGNGIACVNLDLGPAGKDSTGNRKTIYIDRGAVMAVKFSVGSASQHTEGEVSSAKTNIGGTLPSNGATPRMWIAAEAGERSYIAGCYAWGFGGSIRWGNPNTGNTCVLNSNTVYYLNFAGCVGTAQADTFCTKTDPSDTRMAVYASSNP